MEVASHSNVRDAAPVTLADFQFPLPAELIAQEPAARRDASRLLVLDRAAGTNTHAHVHQLAGYLRRGDLLVVNDTRVFPARIYGRGPAGGAIELLLIRPVAEPAGQAQRSAPMLVAPPSTAAVPPPAATRWLCLGKPGRRLRPGTVLRFGDLEACVDTRQDDGTLTVTFRDAQALQAYLESQGEIPLPPYIQRPDGPLPMDRERYQTIFAARAGAVAAPTAGLHFTPELVDSLAAAGIAIARLTLHVGLGTFLPLRTDDPEQHKMDAEWCDIPTATVDAIVAARRRGGRIVAVGTTTTRALESSVDESGGLQAGERWATKYIRPGHRFRTIDALFTNFHLPGSTLLLLVAALAGRERILAAYAEAIGERYRFYSYGDAMLIL